MFIINISEKAQSIGSTNLEPLAYIEIDNNLKDIEDFLNNENFVLLSKMTPDLKESLEDFFQLKSDLIENIKDKQDIVSEEDLIENSSKVPYFLENYTDDFDIVFPEEGLRIVVKKLNDKVIYKLTTMYFNEISNIKYNPFDFEEVKKTFELLTGYLLPTKVDSLIKDNLKD